MSAPKIQIVTALVDWNSQIHAARPERYASVETVTRKTLDYVGKTISRILKNNREKTRFDVTLRLYYGWHKGFEPTPARRVLRSISGSEEANLSIYPNVYIRNILQFGDDLVSANSIRSHLKLACHLPNTLRNSTKTPDEEEEKMVDTALASDLLALAMSEPTRWLMVLAEDDDVVPPVLTAEAIRGKADHGIVLVRRRAAGSFLKLDGLRIEP